MLPPVIFAIILLAFATGLVLGSFVTNLEWKSNSKTPARILRHGKLFKVVDTQDNYSWELAELHKPDKKRRI